MNELIKNKYIKVADKLKNKEGIIKDNIYHLQGCKILREAVLGKLNLKTDLPGNILTLRKHRKDYTSSLFHNLRQRMGWQLNSSA